MIRKRKSLILVALIVVVSPMATSSSVDVNFYAYEGYYDENGDWVKDDSTEIDGVSALGFEFQSSSYSTPDSEILDVTSNGNTVTKTLNTDNSGYYGFYFYKDSYKPYEYHLPIDGGETGTWDINVYPYYDKNCYSLIDTNFPSIGQEGNAMSLEVQGDSAFTNEGPIDYVPPSINSYYEVDTDLRVVVEDINGNIVEDSTVEKSIDFGSSQSNIFSWTPYDPGSYTVKGSTEPVDSSCRGTEIRTSQSTLDVNGVPTASFSSDSPVNTYNDFGLDASGSSDPDSDSLSYKWDTDNDRNYDDATGVSPSVSKSDDGSYTIGLRVSDGNGGTDTTSSTITVDNRDPSVSLSKDESNPLTGESVTFTASASDQDGSINDYGWNIGGSGSIVSNSWGDDGSYTVSVTVTDDDGATASDSLTVNVQNRDPSASFSFSPNSPDKDESIAFDASSSSDQDGSISSYEWDWDNDGNYESIGQTSSHSYSNYGDYDITLKITDNDGAIDTYTQTVSVTEKGSPQGSLKGSNVYYPNEVNLKFNQSNKGDSDVFYTLFRNGELVKNATGNFTFEDKLPAGSYSYNLNTSGGANWTDSEIGSQNIDVKKGFTGINLTLNGSKNSNSTIKYGEKTNVASKINITESSQNNFVLYRNGTQIGSQTGQEINYQKKLAASLYNYTAVYSGNNNYTSKSITFFQTIEKFKSNISLKFNGSEENSTYGYGETAEIKASLDKENDLVINGNLTGLNQGVFTESFSQNILLDSLGIYNISAEYSGDENHTASSQTLKLTVKDLVAPKLNFDNQTLDVGESLEYNVTGEDDVPGTTLIWNSLEMSGFEINSTGWLKNTTTLDPGVYDIEVNVSDGRGNHNSSAFGLEVIPSSLLEDTRINGTLKTDGNYQDISGIVNSTLNKSNISYSSIEDSYVYNSSVNASGITNCDIIDSELEEVACEDTFIDLSSLENVTALGENITSSRINDSIINKSKSLNSNITDYSIIQDSNVTNSTVERSKIMNQSSLANSVVLNSSVYRSEISFSNISNDSSVDNSTVIESHIHNSSKIENSWINNSSVNNSSILNSTAENSKITKNSILNNSVLKDSEVENSSLDNSDADNSTLTNSTLLNSNVSDNSNVSNSQLENVTISNATIYNNTVKNGKITYNDTEYDYSNSTNDTLDDIYENKPPQINYEAPNRLEAGKKGVFNASKSFDPDGHVTNYTWEFSDGFETVNESFTRTFSSKGTINVNLSVKDDFGGTRKVQFSFDVFKPSSDDEDDGGSSSSSESTSTSSSGGSFSFTGTENPTNSTNETELVYNFSVKQGEYDIENISLDAEEGENISLRLENLSTMRVKDNSTVNNGSMPVNISAPLNANVGVYNGVLTAEWQNSSGFNQSKYIPVEVDVEFKNMFFDVNLTAEERYDSGDEINTTIDVIVDGLYRDEANLTTRVYSDNDIIRNNTRNISLSSHTIEEVFYGLAGEYTIGTTMTYRNRSVSDNASIRVNSEETDDNSITGSFSQDSSTLMGFIDSAMNFLSSFR